MQSVITLFLYAVGKAFLPLPSLEIVLLPLLVMNPERLWLYAFIGAIGTSIGGGIGYAIAYVFGTSLVRRFVDEKTMAKASELMEKKGWLAVFIGGITPLPDFILAYVAGLTHMSFWVFSLSDGIARLLRSLLVGYVIIAFSLVLDLDRYGMALTLVLLSYYCFKWGFSKSKEG